jgi:3-oxocholest-4-en-26-oate---CoA ligase
MKSHTCIHAPWSSKFPMNRLGAAIMAVAEPAAVTSIRGEGIKQRVPDQLAAFETPRRIVEMDSIGRAANGKVDSKRLRQPAVEPIEAGAA